MPSTIGTLPQYQVQMALTATPTTLAVIPNRIVSCEITRGRTDELTGPMQVGTMTLVLDNRDGSFSPDNPSSPYAGFLVPGRRVEVDARFDTATAWNPLYFGYIDSIRPEDNGPEDSNVVIQCVDWLGLMNWKNMLATITSSGTGPHDLINWFIALMSAIDATATYTIVNPTDGTSQHFLDYTLNNVTALSALNDFALTARGVVFAGAEGTIRAAVNGGIATTTLFNNFFVFDQPITNPAANVVGYTAFDYDLTTQYLYNDISVTASGTLEGAQVAQDAPSIAAYGRRSLAYQFAYMDTGQAVVYANTLMLAYKDPRPRVHALTIDVDATTGLSQGGHTAADLLFGLELTAPVTVVKQNPGALGINRVMLVQGIAHTIKPDLGGHEITLQLTDAKQINPDVWKLGTSQLGISTVLWESGTAFNPTSIANCSLYLRSDLGVVTAGAFVNIWQDQSGAGLHASGASGQQPTLVANVQNGRPAIRFSTSSLLTLASDIFALNWTAFVVFSLPSPGTAGGYLVTDSNAGPTAYRGMTGGNSGEAFAVDGTNSVAAVLSASLTANVPVIQTGSSAAGQPAIVYLNGSAGISANSSPGTITGFSSPLHAIGGLSGSNSFHGDFFAVVVYSRVLTALERATVLSGLNTLYAVY